MSEPSHGNRAQMAPRAPMSPAAPARAVALRYERGTDDAPRVVAKGQGEIAERILAFARAHGVAVREDPDLLVLLSACDIGAEIPIALYDVVARLLTCLHEINRDLARTELPQG